MRSRAQAGAVCVQKFLSCQLALRVKSRCYLRGGKRRVVQRYALLVLLEGPRPISAELGDTTIVLYCTY